MSARWTLAIGCAAVSITGPKSWVKPFAHAWDAWSGPKAPWRLTLEKDTTLPTPDGPYFNARPRFDERGRCTLTTTGFEGVIKAGSRRAHLRAHPSATPGDLSYFVRTVFALATLDAGGLLFHTAGVVHRGRAYALFGHSGSGKTTAARLSAGKPVLNDDLVLLCPRNVDAGWTAWATPFGRRRDTDVQSAPLGPLLRLIQGPEDRLEPISQGQGLAALLANTPVVNADARWAGVVLNRWEGILQTTPLYRLHFRKANTFWEVIDAYVD